MKKVLVIGDAGAQTGFARVVKGIADHLHGTGLWDVAVRGINCRPNHGIPYEYEVLPISADPANDPMGFNDTKRHLDEVKPDALLVVQDLWNITTYGAIKGRELPSVCYFPVDTPNLKWGYGVGLGAFAEGCCYTEFGAREAAQSVRDAVDTMITLRTKKGEGIPLDQRTTWFGLPQPESKIKLECRVDRMSRFQNVDGWNVIPHGMDLSTFEPRPKEVCREAFKIPQDAFVVGFVNTNQFRKRVDLAMLAFAKLLETQPNAMFVIHCAGGDVRGWDLGQWAGKLGISQHCRAIHHQAPLGLLSDTDLCTLYNTFDVQINTSGGEGWGLTSFEGAACGVPQIVPDWSATRELWADHGILTSAKNWRLEPNMLNTAHCEIDPVELALQLSQFATNEECRLRYAQKAYDNAQRQVSWDVVGSGFSQLLTNALREPRPMSMTFQQILDERQGENVGEMDALIKAA